MVREDSEGERGDHVSGPAHAHKEHGPRDSAHKQPEPVSWEKYWDQQLKIHLPDRGGTFNVYSTGPEDAPVVMCLHGAGYTGLTWSLVATRLKEKGFRVMAPDLRGHGLTTTDNDKDYCKETLSADVVALWHHMFGPATVSSTPSSTQPPESATTSTTAPLQPSAVPSTAGEGAPAAAAPAKPPPIIRPAVPAQAGRPTVVVGHSMGGGIAVWAAAGNRIPGLAGLVVVDVVEGTAVAALPHMMGVIAARPASFTSPSAAISWSLRGGMCRCKDAAAVSLPSQLHPSGTPEHAEAVPGEGSGPWVWRTQLVDTRPHWEGWYTGLSEAFLQVAGPKMLMLAGTDRLDKPLTIGQMQGKFQLVLLPTAGHAIQEDESRATAEHLEGFLKRFRVGQPPMVIPRAPPGTARVLPVVAGPVLQP